MLPCQRDSFRGPQAGKEHELREVQHLFVVMRLDGCQNQIRLAERERIRPGLLIADALDLVARVVSN